MKTVTSLLRIATSAAGGKPSAAALRRLTVSSMGGSFATTSSSMRSSSGRGQHTAGNRAVRFFASDINNTNNSDSHSDFSPQKKKVVSDTDAAVKLIDEHVKANPVMLYMKGTPSQPMCGFSARVVGVLAEHGIDYGSVNVLDYPAIREGIKQYSQWPTIPQLYVQGELVGGCDIVTEMHSSGDLKELLNPIKTAQENEK